MVENVCYIQRPAKTAIVQSSTVTLSIKNIFKKFFIFVILDTEMLDFHLVHKDSHLSE